MSITHQDPASNRPPRDAAVTYLEPALWKLLAETETDEEFCLTWLRLQCRMIHGVTCGVVLFNSGHEGSYVPVASWPDSFQFHKQFAAVVDKVLIEKKGVVLRSSDLAETEKPEQQNYHLAYPLLIRKQLSGVAAIEITPRPAGELQSVMRQLQWGTAWLKNRLIESRTEPDGVVRKRLMTVFDIVTLALQEDRFKSAATKLVTELAAHLDCDRVSVGFYDGSQSRITALSHSAKFDRQTNLIRTIGNAMDECLDQGETLVYPAADDREDAILHSHGELARLHGSGSSCTLPFIDNNGNSYGAITLERAAEMPFTGETVALCEAVAALTGPILEDKRRNDRLLPVKIVHSIGNQLAKLFGRGHFALKLSVLFLAAITVFFSYYESDYRVTAVTTLEGTIQRAIICPFDGFLEKTSFRAGDVVSRNQILASLNSKELTLEQLKWSSEKEQRLLEYNKALAENEIAHSTIILEQINQSQSQIALLQQHIDRALIRAPFTGILISGDLDQSIGAPLQRGEVLFEIAPLHSYRVVIEVDEKDIEQVVTGQQGKLVLNALPEKIFPFMVDKVTPVSISREGRNYFVMEGHLLEISDRLRPGMQGYGKIFVERRKLFWIWTHGLLDWWKLWVWNWLP